MKLNRQIVNVSTERKSSVPQQHKQIQKLSKLFWTGIFVSTLGLLNASIKSAAANDYIGDEIPSDGNTIVTDDYIGNKGIEFQEDTIVEFEFIESHGAYQSTFGVINLDTCQITNGGEIIFESCSRVPLLSETKPSDSYQTVFRRSNYEDNLNRSNDDFIGTPGNTVPQPTAEYLFQRGERYAFYLESYYNDRPAGIVYSVDFLNTQNNRQALFNEELPSTQLASRRNIPNTEKNQFASLIDGGLLLRFDDTGSTLVKDDYQDVDFDDFVVGIGGYESCAYPEQQSNLDESEE